MFPLILAGVVGVASATGTYLYTRNHYETKLAERAAEHANQLAEATANALAETKRLQAAKDAALKAAANRNASLARAAADLRHERDGLRDELASASIALPNASCASVRDHAAALNTVFGQCAAAIERLASQADGHASDSLTLQESWPK
jgi:hypothetical protein